MSDSSGTCRRSFLSRITLDYVVQHRSEGSDLCMERLKARLYLFINTSGENLIMFYSLSSISPAPASLVFSSTCVDNSGCFLESYVFPLLILIVLNLDEKVIRATRINLWLGPIWFRKSNIFSEDYKSKFNSRCKTMFQFVKVLRVMWTVATLIDCPVVITVIFWLFRLLLTSCLRSDLRGHVTDSKTQFLPSVRLYWLVGLCAN